ncbi:MAG: 30S ribosomal protein S3 [Candidatus Andersenbacteria bacterium]
MGHKVNPVSFRIGTLYDWQSRWFNERTYRTLIQEDVTLRDWLLKKLKSAFVSRITIDRSMRGITVSIYTSRPGVIIGRGGAGAEELRKEIARRVKGRPQVKLNIEEVRDPDRDARLIGLNVAEQIEKRIPFRRALRSAVERGRSAGLQGVRIALSGRLNGADMSRTEWAVEGSVPLHTLRADVDFARVTARTTYGAIGVKVWAYKGKRFGREVEQNATRPTVTGQRQLTAPTRGARAGGGTS